LTPFACGGLASDTPLNPDLACVERFLRGNYKEHSVDRFNWDEVIARGCYTNSSKGKIANWDGELIIDNPKFVDRDRHFSLDDTELVVDDLRNVPGTGKLLGGAE
jgi:hypothetical protein